jgi:hypothetical protein
VVREEVANYYFVECIIEGELGILGKRPSSWSPLFAALIEARGKQENVFTPAFLRTVDLKTYYQHLRSLSQAPGLADEIAVSARLSEALEALCGAWKGNARELARSISPLVSFGQPELWLIA